jgi:preprotein translocase subunit SecB
MADINPGANAGAQAPIFRLQRIYLKDASLELPHAPTIFLEQEAPQVDVQLEVVNARVLEGIHEVVVRVTATAKVKDKVLFLVEAKQAGIFEMRGIPNDQFDAVLNIVCPNIVYPYLRANVADLINRTGLPPIHLDEINFEAMYQQRLAQQQQSPNLIVPPGTNVKQ